MKDSVSTVKKVGCQYTQNAKKMKTWDVHLTSVLRKVTSGSVVSALNGKLKPKPRKIERVSSLHSNKNSKQTGYER